MPISESSEPSLRLRYRPPADTEYGFTLIEIMLVLLIIGIMVGLAAISLSTNPATTVDREARRLLAVLNEASDEAISSGTELALALTQDGVGESQYRLMLFDKQDLSWKLPDEEIAASGIWRPHTLADDVSIELTLEGHSLSAQQLEQMARVQALGGPERVRPSILLLSSGELTPFTLQITHRDTDYRATLESDGLSGVYLR